MTLPAQNSPAVHEPRERSAAGVGATIGLAALLWALHISINDGDMRIGGTTLAAASASTVIAAVVITWYVSQKANAGEHQVVIAQVGELRVEVAELRQDNAQIVASIQALRMELTKLRRDNLTQLADEMDESDNVTGIHNWRK